MEAWYKKYDKPTADEESSKLLQAFTGKFWSMALNKNCSPEEVKAKLADPTGNVIVDLMVKKYFDKE